MDWLEENIWEREWWGTCQNTYGEETKQLTYAKFMGLQQSINPNGSPCFNMVGKSVLDIGGGPVSMLLKCFNLAHGYVVDPCSYPDWVFERYKAAYISVIPIKAEDLFHSSVWDRHLDHVDEVWIYNCLQHVEDPRVILQKVKSIGKVLRIFEWVGAGVSPGHPHDLTKELFDREIGLGGCVISAQEPWWPSPAYFGVFQKSVGDG